MTLHQRRPGATAWSSRPVGSTAACPPSRGVSLATVPTSSIHRRRRRRNAPHRSRRTPPPRTYRAPRLRQGLVKLPATREISPGTKSPRTSAAAWSRSSSVHVPAFATPGIFGHAPVRYRGKTAWSTCAHSIASATMTMRARRSANTTDRRTRRPECDVGRRSSRLTRALRLLPHVVNEYQTESQANDHHE
jgi:hypothetical protein